MNTGKCYYDSDGNECSIWQMVEREPKWAAVRIQEGEKAIERLGELESASRSPGCSAAEEINQEMLAVLKDIRRVIGMDSRASHREQTEIIRRMRAVINRAEAASR